MSKLIGGPPKASEPPPFRRCILCGKEFSTIDANSRWSLRCADCVVKLAAEKERMEKEREQRQLIERWNRVCPPLFQDTMDSELPRDLLEKVLSWEFGPVGLILHGPTGVCKTRCMYRLLKELIFQNIEVKQFGPGEFEGYCITKFLNGDGPDWIDQVKRTEVLFFDDFLKAKLTPRPESELFTVLDYRYTHKLPILATTNHSLSELEYQLSSNSPRAFLRRLLEIVEWVEVPLK